MRRPFGIHRRHRRGATLVLFALCLVLLLAFVAFSIDTGYICLARTQLQSAADSSALAGAAALRDGPARARSNAAHYASLHAAAGHSVSLVENEDIQLGIWDDDARVFTALAAANEGSANAVRVYCRRTSARQNRVNLFFARVLGTSTTDVTAHATARARPTVCGVIIGIDKVTMSGSSHTDSYNSAVGAYSSASAGDRGHVCSDGPITMSGSTAINGDAHPGEGYTVSSSSSVGVLGEIEPRTEPLNLPATDPGNASSVNNNGSIPQSAEGKAPLNSNREFTLSGGDSVDLPPGTYYWSKLTLSGGSTINISGETTIYVTGDVSLSGGSVANHTLQPKNLQLFPMGSKCTISGSSEFYGVVYAPTAKVERSGSSDYYGMIVGKELVLSGSGGIHADESLSFLQSGAAHTVLVE